MAAKNAKGKGAKGAKTSKKPSLNINGRKVRMWLSKPDVRRFIVLVAVAIAGVIGYVQVKGNLDAADQAKADTKSIQTMNAQTQADINKLRQQEQDSDRGDSLDAVLKRALPPVVTWDAQFEYLTALAEATGGQLTSFTPGEPTDNAGLKQTQMSLAVECSFADCMRFVNGLQSLTRAKGKTVVADGPLWTVDSISIAGEVATISATLFQFSGATQAETADQAGAAAGTTTTPETP